MIEKMNPHYSLTNPASVYDEEALTALELVGRATAKVNQTVEAFNTLEKNMDNRLGEQDTTIENRMKAQDDRITRMNDETMPLKVKDEMQERIDDGTFESKIDVYAGELIQRVQNLESNYTPGNTTADAELFDIRVGANGVTYETAGEAVRGQIGGFGELVNDLTDLSVEQSVNLYNPLVQTAETVTPHYIGNSGIEHPDMTGYGCTAPIPVKANTEYSLGVVPKYIAHVKPWCDAVCGVLFYDVNGDYVGQTADSTFTTPYGTATLRFNYAVDYGINLAVLSTRCMLVEGNTLPDTFSGYYHNQIKDVAIETRDKVNKDVLPLLYITSSNLYRASEQTPATISPHYWLNGKPYSSTQFDNDYHCTAPIPLEGGKEYTIGFVPSIDNISLPWNKASSGVMCYDANGTYIISVEPENNVFTPPLNTTHIRFNYNVSSIPLNTLNRMCMIVEGNTLPNEYEAYFNPTTIRELVDVKKMEKNTYRFENEVLTVNQNNTVWTFEKHGNNGIFMCSSYGVTEKTISIGTDILSPYIMQAKNNGTGDRTSYSFTGGNHSYNQTSGTPTARTSLIEVFADGKPATLSGEFNTLRVHCRHLVQASNTCMEDGTGRSVLIEDDYFTFDGKRVNVEVHLTPTEEISISRYYSLQLAGMDSYNSYGKTIRKGINTEYTDEVPEYIEGVNDYFKIRMHLDDCGIGDYHLNTTGSKYLQSGAKAYYHPIENTGTLTTNDMLWYKGYFEILPKEG